ncbi:PEP-CTERM sorting domain-containing protein [Psychromonas aquimarina]|uniref:PEP-CTERM sorting domain-containing protein n=1 Tax=Psychromonas aquimarina TaxID=444919 RepID=UPI00048E82B7|nr:PEP-CTERM sorting domain-containing protein [Psychromonas aquimarina]
MNKQLGRLCIVFIVSTLPAVAYASPIIGTPTTSTGTTAVVNSSYYNAATGAVKYFIPIDNTMSDGVYGVDGYGLSSDSGSTPLGSATLDMYLYFDIAPGMTGTSLTLWFDDLDLADINTPTGFFETLAFNESVNGELGGDIVDEFVYTTWQGLEALANVSFGGPIPNNNRNVSMTISGLNLEDDFRLNLQFTSYDNNLHGWYRNTAEYLSAKLTVEPTQVPEPQTSILLAAGILVMAIARRRKQKTAVL